MKIGQHHGIMSKLNKVNKKFAIYNEMDNLDFLEREIVIYLYFFRVVIW